MYSVCPFLQSSTAHYFKYLRIPSWHSEYSESPCLVLQLPIVKKLRCYQETFWEVAKLKISYNYWKLINLIRFVIMEEAWGQLVSLTDVESEPVLMTSDRLTIGRAPGRCRCSVYFDDTKRDWSRYINSMINLMNNFIHAWLRCI